MTDLVSTNARHTYNIPHWSDGYIDVDGNGEVCIQPDRG